MVSPGGTSKGFGRVIGIFSGIALGTITSLWLVEDWQLIRKIEGPSEDGNRPFRVRYVPSQPVKLKPEREAEIREDLLAKYKAEHNAPR